MLGKSMPASTRLPGPGKLCQGPHRGPPVAQRALPFCTSMEGHRFIGQSCGTMDMRRQQEGLMNCR